MIDAYANITLDRAGDEFIPFSYKNKDGSVIDIATATLKFVVNNSFTLIPDPDPANATGRVLHFTEEHAARLGAMSRDYVLIMTVGTIDTPLFNGKIAASGFAIV
jgi:hypothetical protein